MDEIRTLLPLSPAVLYILLALVDEERHGYGITLEVDRLSTGRYNLGPGTLYANLEKLLDRGLIETAPKPSGDDTRRRNYYRLTDFGRHVLAEEVSRLEKALSKARPHLGSATGATS